MASLIRTLLEHKAQPKNDDTPNVETPLERLGRLTTLQQQFTNMVRNTRGRMQPPINDIEDYWSPAEKAHVSGMLRYAFIGSPETLKRTLGNFVRETGADEIMITAPIFDHEKRKRSFELVAEIAAELNR